MTRPAGPRIISGIFGNKRREWSTQTKGGKPLHPFCEDEVSSSTTCFYRGRDIANQGRLLHTTRRFRSEIVSHYRLEFRTRRSDMAASKTFDGAESPPQVYMRSTILTQVVTRLSELSPAMSSTLHPPRTRCLFISALVCMGTR